MDQTGSEESKQPADEGAKPSDLSTGGHHASSEHSEQEDSPESARRAFDLLERFSGELEEILQSLERARGGAAPIEESPPAPERAFRPSSIHFDSSPISTRIDPNALPPVESPGATSPTAPRLLLEALFLILVAAISARTGLRPLFIATAEAVAFLIVASIELAIARERRRIQQLPAATPSFAAPETHEAETTSAVTSFTLEQVEPLVWQSELQEAAAEADWPLAAYVLPSEAEVTEEAQEGATEISSAQQPEAEVEAAPGPVPEAQPEADLENADAPSTGEAEPEAEPESIPEIFAAEVEPEQPRRRHLFRHEPSEPEVVAEPETQDEVEPEAAAELEVDTGVESLSEIVAEEVEPEQPRRFHLFRHEPSEPEVVAEPETQDEVEPEAAAGLEVDTGVESLSEIVAEEVEPEQPRRFHLFRHELSEPEIEVESEPESMAEPEIEPEAEPESIPEIFAAEVEPEAEPEIPEIFAAEVAPEQPRRRHLFRHEPIEPEAEPEATTEPEIEFEPEAEPEQPRRFHLFRHEPSELEVEPESTAEIPASEAEIEPEVEAGVEPEVTAEPEIEFEPEAEPEQPRRFHLFRHEERALDAELAHEVANEAEPATGVESLSEIVAEEVEPEQPRRFHLFRHEPSESEPELDAEAPRGQDDSSEGVPSSRPLEKPGNVAEPVETIEIDLPPETAVYEIERTLEDLGRREPGLRRRRWSHRADTEKAVAVQALEDETADGESEVRLTAEQERRRREREYLRNLRVSR